MISETFAAPKYDIRAVTKDKVKTVLGKAKQGSFGAPALNDKGNIAYPCVLFGNKVDAFTNISIVYRAAGKKGATAAVLTGIYNLNNSFLPGYNQTNTNGEIGSAYFYSFSKAIAINNKNQISFTAEVLNAVITDNYQNGNYVNSSRRYDDRSDYGMVYPSSGVAGGFQNLCLGQFESYFPEVLQRTLSINSSGSVPINADIQVTPTRRVPGFVYSYPVGLVNGGLVNYGEFVPGLFYSIGGAVLGTTESNVIGLPYETTYASFSDAIIAQNNRVFVVADLSDTGTEFDGLWQGTNPNLQPIVVKQTAAPGGGKFQSFDGKAGPNRKGSEVAFIANLTGGSSSRGVFVSNLNGKNVSLIASIGDAAPGTNGTFSAFDLAAVNDRGNVVILGSVTTNGDERPAIWVSDPNGKNLELLIVGGQTFQVGTETKTVTRIACNPVAAINKKGQVAFTASFTDKTSAVIVATR